MNLNKGKGQALWKKAKKIIPGGNQLLSKRAEMFLPDLWPAYYEKAKGVDVWDLDGNRYVDMSIMGIGACVLGYANKGVNQAVKRAIDAGSASTLNCYEEVTLAERLIKLHPWAAMARFARSGGEACAMAVRIARAASKKDKIAFCGYHGWHDWYLSANLSSSKNLDGQLLPGLEPAGVPRVLKNTAFPFHFGMIGQLEKIFKKNKGKVGVIITEVSRSKVDGNFLKEMRRIANREKAVLIFDETSSGFRAYPGGLHMTMEDRVEPDIVVLGKAMGNGHPIAAILGRREVMQAAQDTFISSTFWSERVGYAAALEVIRQFEEEGVAGHLARIGGLVQDKFEEIIRKTGLRMEVVGLRAAPTLVIHERDALLIKTVFTQEMLKKGYLASNIVYVSRAHTPQIVERYAEAAGEVWFRIAEARRRRRLDVLLKGSVCHSGFKRLA